MTALVFIFSLVLGMALGQTMPTTTPKPTRHPPRTTVAYPDIQDVLKANGNYNTVLELLTLTGMLQDVNAATKITVFAPTDDVFASMPADQLAALKADVTKLKEILSYHVVTDQAYHIRGRDNDKVLMSASNLPIRINRYNLLHTVSAEGVNITEQDIHIRNGYVQGLGGVMVAPKGNVVDILSGRPDMAILTSLINKAGLADTIRNDMNITVFAPTDDAFSKVKPDIMVYLGSDSKALTETLLFHIVQRTTLYKIGMKHSMTFPTADHRHDRVMLLEDDMGNIHLNHAKVSEVDISATNGVIHVLDDVLVPIRILVAIEDSGIIVG